MASAKATELGWRWHRRFLTRRRIDADSDSHRHLAKTKAPIATEALKRIAALYEIEADIRGRSAADRRTVRQAESKPLVAELRIWFEAQIAKLPARGPMAEAIRYALNHWDGLQ